MRAGYQRLGLAVLVAGLLTPGLALVPGPVASSSGARWRTRPIVVRSSTAEAVSSAEDSNTANTNAGVVLRAPEINGIELSVEDPVEEEKDSSPSREELLNIVRAGTVIGPEGRTSTIYPQDYTVHRELGICQFREETEAGLLLFFKDEAELIVPHEDSYKISRLKAADAAVAPKLTALTEKGTRMWLQKLDKVRQSTKDAAENILLLYASRNAITRPPCPPDGEKYRQFEEAFEYGPTEDQAKCFNDIERDMVHRRTPMDRLVCGDVGFGKTEVAMRAIFRAALAGRQVALLAPTTVLAAQHYRTLKKRMPEMDIELLRGGSAASPEGRRIRWAIGNGTCQIVVGTHALLSKSVQFKNLEMVVIDEEQRFGVAQKEKLKAMATGIDVLTLSATPIPRTLQMSLSGIRDLSTLRTPPPGRKAVVSKVARYDPKVIQKAIRKEMERGGQTFFVVPRIANIERYEEELAVLVPEARVSVAHGKLKDVEQRIIDFSDAQSDVLVATTVIESGLDLPNANTIIITDPNIFGLAALYQLRGRVGRSPREAYAYFLIPNEPISVDALRRLQAVKELNTLGCGFELANRDLEIRGAGAVVGTKQSGITDHVGSEVYIALLEEAIDEAKGTNITEVAQCFVNLPAVRTILERGLPGTFLDGSVKDEITSEAMALRKPREIMDLGKVWQSRLAQGETLPNQVDAFLKMNMLMAFGRRIGIEEIEVLDQDMLLRVPGWSRQIWEHLEPATANTIPAGSAVFDNDTKLLRIRMLGGENPAKQIAVLLRCLAGVYIFLEGKENFGF